MNHLIEIELTGFRSVINTTLRLTPIHALIGPNDSGKTNILRAIDLSMRSVSVLRKSGTADNHEVQFRARFALGEEASVWNAPGVTAAQASRGNGNDVYRNLPGQLTSGSLPKYLPIQQSPIWMRLDPDAMKQPSELVNDMNERGGRIAGALDWLLCTDVDAFLELREDVRKLFPAVHHIGVTTAGGNKKSLLAILKNGTRVTADMLSEGLLYYLAFRLLRERRPVPQLVLVEEPENGMHPARIAEVMRVLREASESMQIIIATHSPLVVNELEANEVSVITRDLDGGTQARLLSETPNYAKRSQVYSNGELWLAYADGKQEAPLFEEPVRRDSADDEATDKPEEGDR